jgi:hypothetical protein
MEQAMQQIRVEMNVAEGFISTNPKVVQAHYAKMEPLLTRMSAEREADMKATKVKSRANFEKMMADCEVDRKKNADFEKRMAEWKAEQD